MDKIKAIVLNKQMKLETITFPIVTNNLGNFGIEYRGDFYKLNPEKVFLWNNKPTILLNSTFHFDITTQLTDEQMIDKIRETFNRIKEAKNGQRTQLNPINPKIPHRRSQRHIS